MSASNTSNGRSRGTGTRTRSLEEIFALPALVAAASTVGLLSALVGDGWWDALSWLGLGLAVVLSARHGIDWRRRAGR